MPGSAAPPGACSAWTAASASYTGTPISRSIFAAVDLPMPIEPVSPTMTIFLRQRLQQDQGTRTVWPVVLRLSRSICAWAASASG